MLKKLHKNLQTEDLRLIAAGVMAVGLLLGHKIAVAIAGTGYIGAALMLAYVGAAILLAAKGRGVDDEE